MANTLSPNMNLIVPGVGTEPGPTWATDLNASLGILDQHNHSNGQGVQISPSGININSDLPINSNNLTLVKSVEFVSQASPLTGASPFLNTLYFASGNLYANDSAGNQIKITNAGAVNSTSSGISSGTASAAFSAGVLVVNSNTNTPANIQGGSILIGNVVSGSNFATLQAPSALASNYALTLPPTNSTGNTAFLTYDASNNVGVGPATTGGITGTNIASATITQNKIALRATGATVASGGFAISPTTVTNITSGTYVAVANLSVTITTNGNPVYVGLIPESGAGSIESVIQVNSSLAQALGYVAIMNGANQICSMNIENVLSTTPTLTIGIPPASVGTFDFPAAGTYTYTIQARVQSATGSTILFYHTQLIAYELK